MKGEVFASLNVVSVLIRERRLATSSLRQLPTIEAHVVTRFLPACFDLYIARSAKSRISCVEFLFSKSVAQTPMLTVT